MKKSVAANSSATGKAGADEARLERSLPLAAYMMSLVGAQDFEQMTEHLCGVAEGEDEESGISNFCAELLVNREGRALQIDRDKLREYDQNIREYAKTIGANRGTGEPVRWKYFQWLSLLFVEIYLDRYFADKEGFRGELNAFLAKWRKRRGVWQGVSDWQVSDMNKLAFWCATGSGKTLLMHANILQFRRYAERAGCEFTAEILVTPNEGLTAQHIAEAQKSCINAVPFSKTQGSASVELGLKGTVQVIEISKLAAKDGEKTVSTSSFGKRNLVLIDEAHKGSGGDVWKRSREALSEEGFSFEYSATLGQAVNSQSVKAREPLLREYAKAVIFDYAYGRFYADGYGKEYKILNLSRLWDERSLRLYLSACLLSFYEQLLVFDQRREDAVLLNVKKPLLVFVGSSVNAVRREGGKDTSDVLSVLAFIDEFLREVKQSEEDIACLLEGRDGLLDGEGRRVFAGSFSYLKDKLRRGQLTAQVVTAGMRQRIFNCPVAGGRLHMASVRAAPGQIALWAAGSETFGVVNVGDEARLLKLAQAKGVGQGGGAMIIGQPPFESINEEGSSVNVLIGSKKFSEGWNSWRVSAMGLMNVGRGEGSEIIQLFGRGVRLMGEDFSLKRYRYSKTRGEQDEGVLESAEILERLYVFGVRSDYMERFKEYLANEVASSCDVRKVSFTIDTVQTVDFDQLKLMTLRTHEETGFLEDEVVAIVPPEKLEPLLQLKAGDVKLDMRPRVLSLASRGAQDGTAGAEGPSSRHKLTKGELWLVDWGRLWFDIVSHKKQRGYSNAQVKKDDLRPILEAGSWYELWLPRDRLWTGDFESTCALCQEVAARLLCMYMDRVYTKAKGRWMRRHTRVHYIDKGEANLAVRYTLTVSEKERQLIDHIEELKALIQSGHFVQDIALKGDEKEPLLGALYFEKHLYKPLLSCAGGSKPQGEQASKDEPKIEVTPVPLNDGERDFVCKLREFYESEHDGFFKDRRLYLLRNQSRKGVGFFEASGFYPDFVMWLIEGAVQHVAFIDPKGILHLKGTGDPKIALAKTIKETQKSIADSRLTLDSFIISNTPLDSVDWWVRDNPADEQSIADFNARHVYFQSEQQGNYVRLIAEAMLSG